MTHKVLAILLVLLALFLTAGKPDKPPKPDDSDSGTPIPQGSAIVDGDLSLSLIHI
mgnify:CR=1 FL=1